MKTVKNMFHFALNIAITGLILVMVGIGFLMMTDSNNSDTSQMLKVDYSTESIRNPQASRITGNPKKWIILSISEDFSTAKVLKEDGCVYYMTIFAATDDTIDIEVNGEIHTFNYSK